jgi:hypothetical protein
MINENIQIASPDRQRIILLRLLFSFKQELLVSALQSKGIRAGISVSLATLRSRIDRALEEESLKDEDIFDIICDLEGWGNQQIYLYKFTGGHTLTDQWLDENWVGKQLHNCQLSLGLIDKTLLPNEITLIGVKYFKIGTNQHIRFTWVEKRISTERAEEHDEAAQELGKRLSLQINDEGLTEDIVFHAFREITVRGVISFDWNITEGFATLSIYKYTGSDYAKRRDERLEELAIYLPTSDFEPLSISRLMRSLRNNSGEISRRGLTFLSHLTGGKISLASGNSQDLFADGTLKTAFSSVESEIIGSSGNLRWKLRDWTERNGKELGIELYAQENDERVGISSQAPEEVIRYVLQRIRTYCE